MFWSNFSGKQNHYQLSMTALPEIVRRCKQTLIGDQTKPTESKAYGSVIREAREYKSSGYLTHIRGTRQAED